MNWKEMTVYANNDALEIIYGALDSIGVSQVQIEEGRENVEKFLNDTAKYWDFADTDELVTGDKPCVKAYIAAVEENEALIQAVRDTIENLKHENFGIDMGDIVLEEKLVADEDWENNWKAYYKPIEIGKKLLIRPSWEEKTDTDRIVLSIDPGLVFGTGSHHTTRMCLELIEECVNNDTELLDMGCGSGILSIAALLYGAKNAVGVDIDEIADEVAMENAQLNGISSDRYKIYIGDVLSDKELIEKLAVKEYDVITANIVAAVIIALAPTAARLIKKGGLFITSGIIDEKLDGVLKALDENGFEVLEVREGEDWRAILSRKK